MTESLTVGFLVTLWWLLVGHALADFTFQNDTMAVNKNRHLNDISKGVPWYYWMTAHSLIHGGMVTILTANPFLGILESFLHWGIDFAKCEKWTNIHIDQALHALCKIAYVAWLWWVVVMDTP